jgi:putative hemolysin
MGRVIDLARVSAVAGRGITGLAGAAIAQDEMTPAAKAAAAFCRESGGVIETVIAAGGRTDLCALPDGTKAEAYQHMTASKVD